MVIKNHDGTQEGTSNQKLLKENNLNPFETNKIYEFWVNSEYSLLPPEIIEQMIQAVMFAYYIRGPFLKPPFPARTLANQIHWAPMHTGGALVKRIAKWCKDTLEFKLTDDVKTALGGIMRKAVMKDQTYYFDVVTRLKWNRGNFGDHDSCFLTGGARQDIPQAMEEENKFAAIRFFKRCPNKLTGYQTNEDGNIYYADSNYYYTGYSRAFMCFDNYKFKDVTYPQIIIFNGYGFSTEKIGGLVAQFLGSSTKKIGLTNNRSASGGLYVNSDGVLVGEKSIIDTIASYDFGMEWRNEQTVSSVVGFKNQANQSEETEKAVKDYAITDANRSVKYIRAIKDKFKMKYPDIVIEKEPEPMPEEPKPNPDGVLQYIPNEPINIRVEVHRDWARQWADEELEIMMQQDRILRMRGAVHA